MNKKNSEFFDQIPAENVTGQPENAFELINKYGTYNIQPTADSDNRYPTIAQGYPASADASKGFPEASKEPASVRRAAKKGDKGAKKQLNSDK